MKDIVKHFPVNWIDGMKIDKNHFISQDNANKDSLYDIASLNLSAIRYGILPFSGSGESNFDVKIALDNQNILRVTVLSCNAITPGGIRVILPALSISGQPDSDGVPATSFQFSSTANETWWIVLTVNPYERFPAGNPDLTNNPPRYPFVLPTYTVKVINSSEYNQFAYNPYALIIGKTIVDGKVVRIDHDYIPPCYSINSYPDLVSLFTEIEKFLAELETRCSEIVQKIYSIKHQNQISELVMFVCDRVMLFLGQSITSMRWTGIHDSPAYLFSNIAGLGRVIKNTIDLRIGSGKDEMMNYLTKWCELKPGELENMLANLANLRYDNNDINKNIGTVISFVKVISRLFETLSKLNFIGELPEKERYFVTEEKAENISKTPKGGRFFGGFKMLMF